MRLLNISLIEEIYRLSRLYSHLFFEINKIITSCDVGKSIRQADINFLIFFLLQWSWLSQWTFKVIVRFHGVRLLGKKWK